MRIFSIVIILLFLSSLSGIEVSGVISEDTVWTQANSPYEVVGNVTVSSGVTLTIEPGVEVHMGAALLRNVIKTGIITFWLHIWRLRRENDSCEWQPDCSRYRTGQYPFHPLAV